MNMNTLQRLEYDKMIMRVKEYAVSYLGQLQIEKMQPMTELRRIRQALDETVETLAMLKQSASVPVPMMTGIEPVFDLNGTGYVYSEQEFSHIAQFLQSCAQLKKYMASKQHVAPKVSTYARSIHELISLKSELECCLRHGRVTDEASKELAKTRKRIMTVEERLKGKLQSIMSKHRDILQEAIIGMRGDRYVIPIKRDYRKQLDGRVLDESSSGQTLFVEPYEVAHLQAELTLLRADEAREEGKVLSELTGLVEAADQELRQNAEIVGVYDVLVAKAKYALTYDGQDVDLNDRGIVRIQGARHPGLTGMVPLDFAIGEAYHALIITGPNTGGKTVALKTVGLLTLLVQTGLPVPVAQGSIFNVYEQIAADIGDGQSLEQSLSTFSSHIREVIEILTFANDRSLILIDEMATGTDPGEGVGLSIAILEELYRRGATVVATTHYNEIKHFAAMAEGFENARMEFDTETLRPLYRLCIGEAGRSYAFVIAEKLGIPAHIIERSKEITGELSSVGDEPASFRTPIRQLSRQEPQEAKAKPSKTEHLNHSLRKGDCVYVSTLQRTGIVYAEADARGIVGVMIEKRRLQINHKRLTLHIPKEELYPDDYDFDILFESKEVRKRKKLMNRKHVEGLVIEKRPEET